jgi:hypothetical protein
VKHKSLTASMVLLAVGIALSVWGDPTSISISSGSVTVTGPSSTTLHFPIARSGDTSYDAFVQYQTQDGTAIAGTDYTAAMGSLVIPAGATSATIPVTVAGSNISQADKTFQMLLLGGLGAGMGFTPSFAAQQTFGTGGDDPYSVTAADINGDGKPDLIIANAGDHTVSVLLNTTAPGATTPSFATPQTFASGGQPYSVVAADVNGDGKPDLIVANFDNTVSVLLNTTAPGAVSPSFAAQQSFATGNVPISVTAADVNGDGKPDLIVANSSDNTVSVLLNTTAPGATTPSFATQQTFATGNVPFSVTAADINGDGLPDLIVSNGSGNTVSVLLNTTAPGATTPSFANQQTFATGNFPFSVTAADVNGDGKPDLIVANSIDGTVMVLLNTTGPGATTPSFAAQQTFATGTEPISVTAADVNGDGKPDLIVANYVDGTVSVLLNTTPAPTTTFDGYSFSAAQAFAAGSYPDSVTAADVNGDGKPDLIVVDNAGGIGSGNVSVLLNTTAPGATVPSFATGQTFATGNGPNWVTAADLNGDGLPDLIVANYSDNTVSVLLNTTAPGATTPSFANQQTFATGSFPFSVTAADVNGDGLPDLIVANQEGGVSVLLNTTAPGATTPSFATQQTFAAGANPSSVAVADVNGDGLPDLIVTNENGKTVSVLLNTTPPGATTLSFATQQTFATGNIPFSATAVDVNGDGLPDLIVANEGDATVSVLLNTTAPGATVPSFAPQQTFATGSNPESIAAADVNGDGLPDLIVANLGSSTVSVLLNTTAPGAAVPSFATQRTFAANSPFSVTAADINGDGMPDLIVANAGQAAGTVSVLLNALYAVTASGSPATGTIQYSVPTPSPTATATATATATPTATPTTSISVPASLAMGNSPVGDTATKNLTVRNTGTNLLFIGSVTSNNSAEFAATGATTCPPGGLAHLATCTIAIGFTPSALGTRIATLTVNDNTATSPQHVAASGTGTVDMTVTPASYGFGSVKNGSKAVKVIVVHNYQTNPVSLSEGFSGPNAGDFSVTGGTCTSTLAKTSVCTLIVTFAPTAVGTESATMTVTDSPDPLSPSGYPVSFTALATIPESVSPTSLHYANVYQTASKTLSVTVTNKATSGPITLTGTSIGGANAGDFAVTGGNCPMPSGSLAASSSCTYAVTFTPSKEAAESGSLSIFVAEDPNGGPAAIALSGTGVTPVRVVPASIAFGTVAGGHSSPNRTVTVINDGGAAVSLSESVGGANFADFAVTGGTCGSSLSGAGASCTYTLKFTPSIDGAESATIGVSAVGDAASPHNVSLSGTGNGPVATPTATPSATPTPTATATATPTATATDTATSTPTSTPTPEPVT